MNKLNRYPSLKEAFISEKHPKEFSDVQDALSKGNWEGPGAFGPDASDVDFSGISNHNKIEEPPKQEACGAEVHNEQCGCSPEMQSSGPGAVAPGLGRVGAPGSPQLTNFGIGELADEDDMILFDTDLGHRQESPLYAESIYGDNYEGVVINPMLDIDDKTMIDDKKEKSKEELVGHNSFDTAKWLNSHEDDKKKKGGDKKSKRWEDFGQHDYPENKNLKSIKEAPRHAIKVPGGGPEFEEDPFSEKEFDPSIEDLSKLDFPFESDMEHDNPGDEEYIQSLAKQREYDAADDRVRDFGRFIDPDELNW